MVQRASELILQKDDEVQSEIINCEETLLIREKQFDTVLARCNLEVNKVREASIEQKEANKKIYGDTDAKALEISQQQEMIDLLEADLKEVELENEQLERQTRDYVKTS